MKKHSRVPLKSKQKSKCLPKSKRVNKWRLIPLFIFISVLAAFAWYRSVVTVPSINLADGLDAEEAAFLKKSVSVDKKKNSTGVAPAPVVKVTVKDNKTGEEYTSKVVLKNIDEPDKADVTTLTAAITKTVIENNTPVQPSPSPIASGITVAEPGTACGNIADGQWAQTGIRYMNKYKIECTSVSACSTEFTQCVQCVDGTLDLANPEVCGLDSATNYIREVSDKVKAPCYDNKLMYADSTYLEQKGYCVNGEWKDALVDQKKADELEQEELAFLENSRKEDLNPSIAPSQATSNADSSLEKNVSEVFPDTTYFSTRSECEADINQDAAQCNQLPGGGYGIVPKTDRQYAQFNLGDEQCERGEVLETIPPYGSYCVPEIERYDNSELPDRIFLAQSEEYKNNTMTQEEKDKLVGSQCEPGMEGERIFYGKVDTYQKCHLWCDVTDNTVMQECLGIPNLESNSTCKGENTVITKSSTNIDKENAVNCSLGSKNSKCVNGSCTSSIGSSCTEANSIKPTSNDTYMYCDSKTKKYLPLANNKKIYFSPDCPNDYIYEILEGTLDIHDSILGLDPQSPMHISCDVNLDNPNNTGWMTSGTTYLNFNISCNPLIDTDCKYNTTIHELAHSWATLQNDIYSAEYQDFNKYIGCTENPENIGTYSFKIEPFREYGHKNCREAFATTIEAYVSPLDACAMKENSKELYSWVLNSPSSPLFGKEFCTEPVI